MSQVSNETSNYLTNEVPSEIKKWNWGAFIFNIFWGIGNKSYLPLLCLIPFFNFVWVFFCGAKGNEWAWKAGGYTDIETFKAVQATWNRSGLVAFIIYAAIFGLYIILFGFIYSMMANLAY